MNIVTENKREKKVILGQLMYLPMQGLLVVS